MTLAPPLVSIEIQDKVAWVTLSNTAKCNALSSTLVDALLETFARLEAEHLPVIVLRAPKGARVWSAGHDITELPKHGRDPLGYYDSLERCLRAVQHYPGVIVAMIDGSVWGGACDLVLTCDIVIGDASCSFAITPAKIGIPYNVSGIQHFISRLGMNRAKEMFFTGRPLDAHCAFQWGFLNHLVEKEVLEPFTRALAEDIASNSHLAICAIKEQFRILDDARPVSAETFERIQGLRRKVYDSHDYTEGIEAFLEKRPPVFRGD
jgi:methylmalonyl-CoA decarboxylase